MRPGTGDARAVLALWCAKRTFFPLVWIGLDLALVVIGGIEETLDAATGNSLVDELLSPASLVGAAVGLRIVTGFVALLAGLSLTGWTRTSEYPQRARVGRIVSSWLDRLHLARGYRALRWTSVVRIRAAERLGDGARVLTLYPRVARWVGWLAFVAFVVIGVAAAA